MIKSKLKAKNCNRGQLFRPCWVSSARCSKLWSNPLVDWYPLNVDGDDLRWNSNPIFFPISQCHMQNTWQGTIRTTQNIMPLPRQGNCGQSQTCPAGNHGQTMLKMSSISDLKRPTALKILNCLTWWCIFFAFLCTIMLNYKRYRGYRWREDMNFMFEWQEQYLMSKRSELRVR